MSGLWSNPGNWSPAGVPSAADSLVFPAGAANVQMTNDLPAGTSVGPMNFSSSYRLTGNALTLTGDISFGSGSPELTFNVPFTLGSSVTFGTAWISNYNYPIDINGHTLTINTPSIGTGIFGSLNGTGAIVVNGGGLLIMGNGNFSGTITGTLNVRGSVPNATVYSNKLMGKGTAGNTTVSGQFLPGDDSLCCGFAAIGELQTKSLALSGAARFDFDAHTADRVQVTGSVTLGGTLSFNSISGIPAEEKQFTIISNDGSDAVSGTFSGLPEGATFTVTNSYPPIPLTFSISYHGGDGNDVVATVVASQKRWKGTASGLWSNAQNWSSQAPPAPGQLVLFPYGASNLSMTNDLPAGTVLGDVQIDDSYTLSGNELTLNGGFNLHNGPWIFVCNAPLKLAANSYVMGEATSIFNGSIDVNGQKLTVYGGVHYAPQPQTTHRTTIGPLTGGGTVMIFNGANLQGSGTFSGTISGHLNVLGSEPNATVSSTRLSGTGTLGNTTVNGSLLPGDEPWCCSAPPASGVLHTKSLTLDGQARFDLVPGGISDQVRVTGSVNAGGTLTLAILSGTPAAGESFTLIDNDGSDAVNGTFTGLPERSTITVGAHRFRITYKGGDGNDVVVAVVTDTVTALGKSSASTKFGEPLTLTATVTASATPTGTVTFIADGASLGTAPVQNGIATLSVSTLEVGARNLSATFLGSGGFNDSVSGGLAHTVARGLTTSAVVSNRPSSRYGEPVVFTVTVTPQAPAAGQPSGDVTVFADGVALVSGKLANGSVSLQTIALHAGTRSITAAYLGDAHFEPSNAPAVQVLVTKTATSIEARPRTPSFAGFAPVVVVTVTANGSAMVPAGAVSVSEGATLLGQQSLDVNGSAQVTLPQLAAGAHELTVRYAGNADFEPSTTSVTLNVVFATISIAGAQVTEGNAGTKTVTLPLTLSAPVAGPVRVSFATLSGTAAEGVDYEKASGVVEFAPGQQSRAIEIRIIGDLLFENDETFSVVFSDAVNGAVETPSVVVVITNDDTQPPRRRPVRH